MQFVHAACWTSERGVDGLFAGQAGVEGAPELLMAFGAREGTCCAHRQASPWCFWTIFRAQDVPVAGPESLLRFGATVTLRTVTTGEEGGERVTEQTLLQTHATDKHAGGHGKSSRRNRHSLGAEAGLGAAEGVESGAGTAEAASAAGPSDVPLSCDCAAWSCHCNKDCMCKMRADTFGGERLGPEAALEGIANVSPDFQCTCNPTEVGGPNPSGGGSVDCDCAEAQCRCERRCACRPKA